MLAFKRFRESELELLHPLQALNDPVLPYFVEWESQEERPDQVDVEHKLEPTVCGPLHNFCPNLYVKDSSCWMQAERMSPVSW